MDLLNREIRDFEFVAVGIEHGLSRRWLLGH